MMISIEVGSHDEDATMIAKLYWQSFGPKLGKIMGKAERAELVLSQMVIKKNVIVARDAQGQVTGFIGVKREELGLISWQTDVFTRHYGFFSGLARLSLLSFLNLNIQSGVLQIDGFCVAQDKRGKGIGSALMAALEKHAREEGQSHLRLEVVDHNTRARELYVRMGFVTDQRKRLGILKYIFGFTSSESMIRFL